LTGYESATRLRGSRYARDFPANRTGDASPGKEGSIGCDESATLPHRCAHDAVRGAGPDAYCEYPANLLRIVNRFLLGIDLRLDSSVVLAPVVIEQFWQKGFGQTLVWRGRTLRYRMSQGRVEGTYYGSGPQKLGVRFPPASGVSRIHARIDGRDVQTEQEEGLTCITLPASRGEEPRRFEIGE
jgi:hypothetical protein